MDRWVKGKPAAGEMFLLAVLQAALGLRTGARALVSDSRRVNSSPTGPQYSPNQKGPGLREDGNPRGGSRLWPLTLDTNTSLCPLSSICSSSSSDTIPAFAAKEKARLRARSGYLTLRARHHNSLIFSCLRIRSTFFSRYSDCIKLHLLMRSTNCWDRTPC